MLPPCTSPVTVPIFRRRTEEGLETRDGRPRQKRVDADDRRFVFVAGRDLGDIGDRDTPGCRPGQRQGSGDSCVCVVVCVRQRRSATGFSASCQACLDRADQRSVRLTSRGAALLQPAGRETRREKCPTPPSSPQTGRGSGALKVCLDETCDSFLEARAAKAVVLEEQQGRAECTERRRVSQRIDRVCGSRCSR